MPIKPTVFIIGAGASNEVGLPIGSGLREVIAAKLAIEIDYIAGIKSGDRAVIEAMKTLAGVNQASGDLYFKGALAIKNAMTADLAPSIDSFLDHHADKPELVTVGKLAISCSILEAEKASRLRHKDQGMAPTLSKAKGTWYPAFLNLIGSAAKATKIEDIFDSITIVCFNYDRCIEQYLTYALRAKFLCSEADANRIVGRLKIFHPYGTVGSLPGLHGSSKIIPFGANGSAAMVRDAANGIRIFTEQWEDKAALGQIHEAIQGADALVFLGFGFIFQNMELLRISNNCRASDVFYTAMGVSQSDRKHVQQRIFECFYPNAKKTPNFYVAETCVQMFADHHHGLQRFVLH